MGPVTGLLPALRYVQERLGRLPLIVIAPPDCTPLITVLQQRRIPNVAAGYIQVQFTTAPLARVTFAAILHAEAAIS